MMTSKIFMCQIWNWKSLLLGFNNLICKKEKYCTLMASRTLTSYREKAPALYGFMYFSSVPTFRISCFLSTVSIGPQSSYRCFLNNCDYRCKPPWPACLLRCAAFLAAFLLISTSQVAGITGVSYQTWFILILQF
jgi:hypothetical protein